MEKAHPAGVISRLYLSDTFPVLWWKIPANCTRKCRLLCITMDLARNAFLHGSKTVGNGGSLTQMQTTCILRRQIIKEKSHDEDQHCSCTWKCVNYFADHGVCPGPCRQYSTKGLQWTFDKRENVDTPNVHLFLGKLEHQTTLDLLECTQAESISSRIELSALWWVVCSHKI